MFKCGLSRKIGFARAVLVAGLLATVFGSLQLRQGIKQEVARQFAFTSDQVTLKIQDRLGACSLMLRGGEAFFSASREVDRNEWRTYIETLLAGKSVPGLQGMGFTQVVARQQLAAHIASIRGEGFSEYAVWPPGERAIYTPVIYIEPFHDRNRRAFGYDMYSEPLRRAAMEQARDTGEAAVSGKVKLVQETDADVQAGFLMYVPVYRSSMPIETAGQRQAALIGWIYSPFRMNDLMTGVLQDWVKHDGKTVDLTIFDGLEATPAAQLFDSKPADSPDLDSVLYQRRTIDFNGHKWLLMFAYAGKPPAMTYLPAMAVLIGGFALSSLLFGLLLSVINTENKAVRIAEGLTKEIRHHEELLQESEAFKLAILNSVPAEIAVLDREGVIQAVNEPWQRFALENSIEPGIPAAHTEIGANYLAACQASTNLSSSDEPDALVGIQSVLDGTLPSFSLEYPCHSLDRHRWFMMTVTPLRRDSGSGVVITHTDITGRKQIEAIFRGLFDQSSFLAGILDQQGKLVDVNSTALNFIDVLREEIIGKYFPDTPWWSSQEERGKLIEVLNLANMGIAGNFETTHTNATGQQISVLFSATPIFLENGNLVAVVGVDITARKQAERALRESESRFRTMADSAPVLIWIAGVDKLCQYFNKVWLDFTGRTMEQEAGNGWAEGVHPDDFQRCLNTYVTAFDAREAFTMEYRLRRFDGEYRWLTDHGVPRYDDHGTFMGYIGSCIDITEHKLLENEREEALTRLQKIASRVPGVVYQYRLCPDGSSCFPFASEAIREIYRVSAEEVREDASKVLAILHPDDIDGVSVSIQKSARELTPWSYEYRVKFDDATVHWLFGNALPQREADGSTLWHGFITDITERKQLEEHERELERCAHYDALTGLPNRVLLADRLHQGMVQVRRGGQRLALAYLDLDGFKAINDKHGHEAGDQMLTAVSTRMKHALREGDTLARMGGDEFVAVLIDSGDIEASIPILSRLLDAAAQPVQFGNITLQVSASLGVTFYSQTDDVDADHLLRQADHAMYQAKMAGKNRYHVYEAGRDKSGSSVILYDSRSS